MQHLEKSFDSYLVEHVLNRSTLACLYEVWVILNVFFKQCFQFINMDNLTKKTKKNQKKNNNKKKS